MQHIDKRTTALLHSQLLWQSRCLPPQTVYVSLWRYLCRWLRADTPTARANQRRAALSATRHPAGHQATTTTVPPARTRRLGLAGAAVVALAFPFAFAVAATARRLARSALPLAASARDVCHCGVSASSCAAARLRFAAVAFFFSLPASCCRAAVFAPRLARVAFSFDVATDLAAAGRLFRRRPLVAPVAAVALPRLPRRVAGCALPLGGSFDAVRTPRKPCVGAVGEKAW